MKNNETIESVTACLADDPVLDTVHQPYAAYNQGFSAFGLGLKLGVNPYPQGLEYDFWDMGWKDAKEIDDDDTGGVYSDLNRIWRGVSEITSIYKGCDT